MFDVIDLYKNGKALTSKSKYGYFLLKYPQGIKVKDIIIKNFDMLEEGLDPKDDANKDYDFYQKDNKLYSKYGVEILEKTRAYSFWKKLSYAIPSLFGSKIADDNMIVLSQLGYQANQQPNAAENKQEDQGKKNNNIFHDISRLILKVQSLKVESPTKKEDSTTMQKLAFGALVVILIGVIIPLLLIALTVLIIPTIIGKIGVKLTEKYNQMDFSEFLDFKHMDRSKVSEKGKNILESVNLDNENKQDLLLEDPIKDKRSERLKRFKEALTVDEINGKTIEELKPFYELFLKGYRKEARDSIMELLQEFIKDIADEGADLNKLYDKYNNDTITVNSVPYRCKHRKVIIKFLDFIQTYPAYTELKKIVPEEYRGYFKMDAELKDPTLTFIRKYAEEYKEALKIGPEKSDEGISLL